jgi:hypothetical protein
MNFNKLLAKLFGILGAAIGAFFIAALGSSWVQDTIVAAFLVSVFGALSCYLVLKHEFGDTVSLLDNKVCLFALLVFVMSYFLIDERSSENRFKVQQYDQIINALVRNRDAEAQSIIDHNVWLARNPQHKQRPE